MKYYSTISIILFFIINGCQQKPIDSKPQDLIFKELFKDQSVFYNKIPQNPSIDSSSDLMVKSLMESAKQGFLIAVKKWTVTVFYADSTTPRYSVKLTASWSPKKELLDVPIPDFAEPDPSADGSMVVIDESNGCVYDFWQVRFNNKNWKSSWANAHLQF